VITFRNPVHSAISLLGTFLVVAALFILRHAEFLAAVQIMVYAGGIMVLFLFVIMLVNVRRLQPSQAFLSRHAPVAVVGGVLLGAVIAFGVLLGGGLPSAEPETTEVLRTVPELRTPAEADTEEPAADVDTDSEGEVGTAEPEAEKKIKYGNTEAVGGLLYSSYLVPFEVVSVVLLVAMIAAIIYGRREAALEEGSGRSEQ
jgi:NADH-quinone oxidoreductase subunit J